MMKLTCLLTLLFLTACVTIHKPHHVLFYDDPSLRVLEYGRIRYLGPYFVVPGKKEPVSYELTRDAYTVDLVRSELNGNLIYLKARDKNKVPLEIRVPKEELVEGVWICGRIGEPEVREGQKTNQAMDSEGVKEFEWYHGPKHRGCISGTLHFRVFDNNGNLLGEEHLPFRLQERDGAYFAVSAESSQQ